MRCAPFLRIPILLLPFCLSVGLQAGEWEFGLLYADAQTEKGSLTSNGTFPMLPYAIVQNGISGTWSQGGVQVGYRLLQKGDWGLWIHGQYNEGLAHPAITHSGEYHTSVSTEAETFNGTGSIRSSRLSLGLARRFSFGEFGLSLGPRNSSLSVDGNTLNQTNGVFSSSHYSASHAYKDTFVAVSFTATQDQGTFRSFQKIAFGTGFGSTVPTVDPGPSDWKMREAYLAQFRPNREFWFTLGVRL